MESEGFVDLSNSRLQSILKKSSAVMQEEAAQENLAPHGTAPVQRERPGRAVAQNRQSNRRNNNGYGEIQYNAAADNVELTYDDANESGYSSYEEDLMNESIAKKNQRGGVLGMVEANPINMPDDNTLSASVPQDFLDEINPRRQTRTARRTNPPASQAAPVDYNVINTLITNAVSAEINKYMPLIAQSLKPVIDEVTKKYANLLRNTLVNDFSALFPKGAVDSLLIGGDFKVVDKTGRTYNAHLTSPKQ